MRIRFNIEGLHCANCASKIEHAIRNERDVESASLDFTRMVLTVRSDLDGDRVLSIIQPIADRIEPGTVFVPYGSDTHEDGGGHKVIATAVCAVVFLTAFLLEMFGNVDHRLLSAVFLITFVAAGAGTMMTALRNILRGDFFDEDFLMTVATVGAVMIGQYAEAAAVMVLFSIGELIEERAVGSSRRKISAFSDMSPKLAHVETDGIVKDVVPEDVRVGDVIVIRPGERVPLDGTLIDGTTDLDTSALTGESVPMNVSVGDMVLSGSVNTTGTIRMEVTKDYEDSTLSRIMDLMESAGERKARSERFITRFARTYTPTVCVLALLVAVIPIMLGMDAREWIYRALTFLVLSCPCALVISVPLTVMGGMGCASSNGILVKGGNYLEMLSGIDTMAFDKTGTLTNGEFSVVGTESVDDMLLAHVAVALESHSNHPIAKAVCRHFPASDAIVNDVREVPGHGITGTVDGHVTYAGNASFMRELGHDVDDSEGRTSVHVVLEDRYLGHIDLMDVPKDGAKESVENIRSLGVRRVVMLTGDKGSVAERISEELSLDGYMADMLPQDKLTSMEGLISESKGVTAFVGDGINDGPTLRRADLGISMGQMGSDTAMEASDIIIAGGDLSRIPLAIRISRRTMRIVKQNIVMSLGIKAGILALTLLGLSGMWGAVIGDVGACILAILNSLRALRI